MKKTALITATTAILIAGPVNGLTAATQERNMAMDMPQQRPKHESETAIAPAYTERCTGFFYASRQQSISQSDHGLEDIKGDVISNLR